MKLVIKCGGSTLQDLPSTFFEQLHDLTKQQIYPVIVHGGGPAISQQLEALNIQSEFVNGLRKTTAEVLDVVEMVLCGKVNKWLTRQMLHHHIRAVGLSGMDDRMIQATAVEEHEQLGYVGSITNVNPAVIHTLIDAGIVPIIAPLGIDETGMKYNINADTAAGAIAAAIGSDHFVVTTDVDGIIQKQQDQEKLLSTITKKQIQAMIASGEIYGGMIPKVSAAIDSLNGGVKSVTIVNGKDPHALLNMMQGKKGGTTIINQ
ncbi:acetylglutamate kinase [Longirhabdus pacifica]|uniref:acetylglutamate kinase n=1 Tax=Longirhabdus pacifica TaxID=2305227 RepID=UPI0010090DF1|nr:acetylglutamate kinase [Longirhabdus pacifica]